MSNQKYRPISIFRRYLLFRSLHHLFCVIDFICLLLLPLVVLPFLLGLHLVVFVTYMGAAVQALLLLSPQNCGESISGGAGSNVV